MLTCGDFGGKNRKGKKCSFPAGGGTDHAGKGRCRYHPLEKDGPAKVWVDPKKGDAIEVFLNAYREHGSIRKAVQVAGINRRTHYYWLDSIPGYREAFEAAKEDVIEQLEEEARRRAYEGVERPVGFFRGVASERIREYSDALLIFLLKANKPEKYRERYEFTGKDGGPIETVDVSDVRARFIGRIGGLASRIPGLLDAGANGKPSPN